ncbi:hypothetical protein [Siphonobacter sp. SORGH_AS_1065]|uniref:hypothetical protein n=1 Tax=Siphonobacter sp. SORGH_AS_1065 TaxID=3041795 RepID=UPI0027898A97|nr:hypothetical protein [Siphonobacter sp. SORGH_AS_1065]MDQ1090277.1 hypothetical protein [Siphonobacter sp. SORGH_AS_1065]
MKRIQRSGSTFFDDKKMVGSIDDFAEKVLELLATAEDFQKPSLPLAEDTWAGVMRDTQNAYYAVFASGQGTPYFTEVQYLPFSEADAPDLWAEIQKYA